MPAKKSGVQFAGINISGGEYGVDSSGTSHPSGSSNAYYYAPGGTEQFAHFFSKGANIFRIPAGWQYLVADKLSGPLDETYMSQYDLWVQACLATGAKCILDVHNYGRWNGQIVGQSNGAVKDEDLMDLWAKLAKRYPQPNIIYEIINEPHDMNEPTWKNTVQKVVHAIRDAGSTSNWILLPGNAWTSAKNWETNSGDLLTVTDSDGSTDRLIIDVHRYMDADGSGTTAECVQNTIDDSLAPLAAVLRRAGRRALLTETGGGNTTSCLRDVCQALAYINQNADVYLGWLGFSAGGFKASDVLDETPNADGSDVPLVQQCILGQFPGSSYYSPVHDTILPRSGPELSVDPLPPHSFANLRVGVVCTSVLIFFLLVL